MVTTTLKVVAWRWPVLLLDWIGLLAISSRGLELAVRHRVDRHLRDLAQGRRSGCRSRPLRPRPSSTDMSAIVSSTVPALFMVPTTAVSPSSMLRRVTSPSIGDEMIT
jgi:hypothetical protein